MDPRTEELWAHAPAIVEKLSAAIKQPSGPSAAREDLFSVLGIDGGPQTVEDGEENKAGIDDFEYALQAALLQRLEQPESDDKEDVPRIIELAAECVCALYERASAPDVSASETDRSSRRYPICVDTCPQGELIVCPKNQNRKTTTAEPSSTSTENAYAHYFHSIKESNNGGLPYPPYPSDGAYEQYPPGHAFRYPFYQTPFHYPPPIYPPPIPTGTTWNPENNPTEGLPKSEKVTSVQSPVDPSEHRRILSLASASTEDKTPLVNTWATLINSYWPLLVAAGTGVVMSYVFMTLLRFRAAMLDRFTDGLVAVAGLVVGLGFSTITWSLREATDLAVECIEWSCKAVLETPTLGGMDRDGPEGLTG
eukprot:g19132.t1